jgi:hypothetical protein
MQITDIIPTPYFSQSLLLSGWQSISAVWIWPCIRGTS